MNISEIEAFLTVVKKGNISIASKALFISQSTLSQRIMSLEKKVGYQLLFRERGKRNVELTELGKEFMLIAEQFNTFWVDMQSLKNKNETKPIIIGTVDSINNFSFAPLYLDMLHEEKNLDLQIKTFHSYEIHGLLEDHSIDIGFVFSKKHNKNLITKAIYTEPMFLVCHRDSPYYPYIKAEELPRCDEVFLIWGPDYLQWHEQYWNSDEKPYVTVNTGSMLVNYLIHNQEAWAIVPLSIIQSFHSFENLVQFPILPKPPNNTCYQLIHRYPKPSHIKGIELFSDYLNKYLNTCEWIEEVIR
ncbi:MAG TPA: LysR family transcriptional regulator [Proteiniclasticum sp.]|nr:LysR family transcriptional regulator [Proteiniclasticum sp.]